MILRRKHAIIGLAILVLLLVLVPQPAEAGSCAPLPGLWDTADCFASILRLIAFFFNFIGGVLFALAGMLVNLMLSLNLTVLDDSNTLVHVGWRLVRDIANLGFVLVIIVIAFATILRFEQYGVTKLLPKLIAAAIIVNFSFAIAAAFINFTNVLTNFFASRALSSEISGPWDLSSALANAFGPQRFSLAGAEGDIGEFLENAFTGALTSIVDLAFTVIFTFIAAFVLLAFAFMLLLRYLYITFLVILAPLVWLFWVVPALAGQFNKWWNKFFQWIFFAPASMFFVYLALISVKGLGDIEVQLKDTGGGLGGFFTGVLQNTMIQGAQMVVLSGILIGGLIIAQKMSILGAGAAVGGAKGMAAGAGKWALSKGGKLARRPFTTRPGQPPGRIARATGAAMSGLQRFSNWKPQNKFARYASAPLRAPFQAAAGGLVGGITAATRPKEEPTTLLGFMTRGALTGAGLQKKKGRKVKGRTATGEVVEIELPEEEGGGVTPTPPPSPTPPPPPPPPESPFTYGEREIS
ncbi:MAG: hypothetical protein HY378_01720 [Candidatus Brennerbacteria bacterium]|nr:hypothetical protein [Candidatus Brennerbacteria bacterium]